ncbi:hypothetical protein BJ170DRAFT_637993 [Xylariales sp. AK1849]|nr:hypothetical protein BJ170DRAFT_637993 [Xylariales sp. AK1849]
MRYDPDTPGQYYGPPAPPARRRLSTSEKVFDAIGVPPGRDRSRHRSRNRTRRSPSYSSDEDNAYYSHDEERPRHHSRKDKSRDYYYEEDEARPRRLSRSVAPRDTYYYEDERPLRGRSAHTDSRNPYNSHTGRHGARSASRPKWRQATEAAAGAALIEGWRSRKNPERIGRIATAAVGAAGTAWLVGKEGDRHNKRHVAAGTIGGLVLDRVINGKNHPRRR